MSRTEVSNVSESSAYLMAFALELLGKALREVAEHIRERIPLLQTPVSTS